MEHLVLFARVGLDSLLRSVPENYVTESVTLRDLTHDITGTLENRNGLTWAVRMRMEKNSPFMLTSNWRLLLKRVQCLRKTMNCTKAVGQPSCTVNTILVSIRLPLWGIQLFRTTFCFRKTSMLLQWPPPPAYLE